MRPLSLRGRFTRVTSEQGKEAALKIDIFGKGVLNVGRSANMDCLFNSGKFCPKHGVAVRWLQSGSGRRNSEPKTPRSALLRL